MKRVALILSLLLICYLGAWATPAATDKPLIFVNTNVSDPGVHSINGLNSKFADAARANGFRIDQGVLTELTDDFLENVDILYLAIPKFSLLDSDKQALRKFMRNGGGVLIMTFPNYADLSNIDSFVKDYGISFGLAYETGFVADVPQDCALAGPKDCEKVSMMYTNHWHNKLVVDTSKAVKAANTTHGPVIAYSTSKNLGKGHLVVVSNDSMFTNYGINRDDNKNMAINILNHLAGGSGGGGYDFSMVLCKYKGKNLSGGDNITLIAKVKNIGSGDSDTAKLSFYISDDGTLSAPPSTMATLKTTTIPVLGAGKKKKIKITAKLPAWLAPGTYYLHAVADPGGKTTDPDTSNNEKVCSKELIVN